MAHSTIAADIHQTLNIQLNFRTEISLNFVLRTNHGTNITCLFVCPILHFNVFVNTGLSKDLCRATATYTINISQSDLTSFILRQINTNNSYCHILIYFFLRFILPLTHFVLGVLFVNNIQTSLTTHNFAVWSTLLQRCSCFHILIFLFISKYNATFRKIIRTHLNPNFITRKDLDVVHPHFPRNVPCYFMSIF